MLVLSRKLGQRFQLGDDVRITIVKIDRHNVRVGIEAPHNLLVQREEILPPHSPGFAADACLDWDADVDADDDDEWTLDPDPRLSRQKTFWN